MQTDPGVETELLTLRYLLRDPKKEKRGRQIDLERMVEVDPAGQLATIPVRVNGSYEVLNPRKQLGISQDVAPPRERLDGRTLGLFRDLLGALNPARGT
jgi:hypothetical protein